MVDLLRSIPGIGLLEAKILIVELVDMERFGTVGLMHSFLGLTPSVYASEDTGIIKRHNSFLRPILIQAA
ncbi:transposase [Pseudozobellia sp. WGM2]|uniref:transposase n=1 Tax=Pseudozobellia sp. WGM2 TaxID=2787625 RepID=UPI001AE0BCFB